MSRLPGPTAGQPPYNQPREGPCRSRRRRSSRLLRSRGENDKASQADGELPDQVDTEQHAGLLQKFGIDPQDLISQLGGGGIGEKLGL